MTWTTWSRGWLPRPTVIPGTVLVAGTSRAWSWVVVDSVDSGFVYFRQISDTKDRDLRPRSRRAVRRTGIATYGTDLDNPDFAGIAKSAGLFGATVEKADELEDALRAAFGHLRELAAE
jgi:thiamine pyrophosphate-dependent enzyme